MIRTIGIWERAASAGGSCRLACHIYRWLDFHWKLAAVCDGRSVPHEAKHPAWIRLPFSIRQPKANIDPHNSNLGTGREFRAEVVVPSAELYGLDDDPHSFVVLRPNQDMLIRASSRVQLNPGHHSITAHAELLSISQGTSQVVGTADAEAVAKTLSKATR